MAYWESLCKRAFWAKVYHYSFWVMLVGMGVIGEWRFFIPLFLSGLLTAIFRSRCLTKLQEYKKLNSIPEAVPEKKKSGKKVSRYNILKET
jgi:hypothetical protein